ncbi:MAG TPA: hypothetical protein VE800_05170, partial [Actinomycetota bacterium]|nr:hypothetical protein [Actinomycetota bacterium]
MTVERGGPPDDRDRDRNPRHPGEDEAGRGPRRAESARGRDLEHGITDEIETVLEGDFGDEFGADVAAELEEGDGDDSGPARDRAVQETVEADVLALGDAEEAAEAVAAERGPEPEPPQGDAEDGDREEGEAEGEAEAEQEAQEPGEDAGQSTEEAPVPAAAG